MSRMNASWSNPNHLSDALPEFLRSPMTVAIGASILAHGVFFLGLPVVANSPNKADLQPIKFDQTALTDREKADLPPSMTQAVTSPLPSSILPSTGTLQDALKPNPALPPTTPGLSDSSIFSPKYDSDQPTSTWIPPIISGTDNSATVDLLIRQRNEVQEQLAAEKARNLALATKEAEKKEAEKKEIEKKEAEKKAQQAQPAAPSSMPPIAPSPSSQGANQPQPGGQSKPSPTTPNPQSPKQAQIAYARAHHQQAAERVENGFVYNSADTNAATTGLNPNWWQIHLMRNSSITKEIKESIVKNLGFQKSQDSMQMIEIFNDFKPDQVKDFKGDKPLVIAYLVDPSGSVIKDSVGIEVGSGYASINKLAVLESEIRLKDARFPASSDGKYMIRKLAVKLVKRSAPPA
jgi:hypothetical protein